MQQRRQHKVSSAQVNASGIRLSRRLAWILVIRVLGLNLAIGTVNLHLAEIRCFRQLFGTRDRMLLSSWMLSARCAPARFTFQSSPLGVT